MLASLLLFTGEAKPCGGAFGTSYTIQPAQKIVVSYHNGVETYVFNPNFCGKADSFGLILPIPSVLTSNPELGKTQLYTDLASVAAPTIVTTQACMMKGSGGGASTGVGGSAGGSNGTTVIQRGQVGIFDWALLQATSVASFTEWLTANGFPYSATTTNTFQPYVDKGWYFVAFKVSPGGSSSGTAGAGPTTTGVAGSSSATICGSFGPVGLSFAIAPNPVIPARIASVSSTSLSWDIFAIAPQQMRMQNYTTILQFSGAFSSADLASYSSLATVAQSGDRLTELMFTQLPANDLILEPDPAQADYRRVINQVQYVLNCTAGTSSGGASSGGASSGGASAGGNSNRGGSAGSSNVGGGASGGKPMGGSAGSAGLAPNGGQVAVGGTGIGGAATGGLAIGGAATGGLANTGGQPSNGGVAQGGATVATSGVAQGGATVANGGAPLTGGTPGIGGNVLSKNGGSTSVGTSLGGATVVDRNPDDDGGCSIESRAAGRVPRGVGLGMLLMALASMCHRRRLRRHE
jgi:hypothetical protein